MKKTIILFLLITGFANAQVVNIPDVNFKNKLIQLGVDTNSDGNIQQSEALDVYGLSITNSNISNLTGIQSFTNLASLNCSGNQLTQLDVTMLTQLIHLDCGFNQLTQLNVSGLAELTILDCRNNQIFNLDVSNLSSLINLNCEYNQINSLNCSGLINLGLIVCSNNFLSNLNLTGCLNLVTLIGSYNSLIVFDASTLIELETLYLSNNNLLNIDLSSNINLVTLDLSSNSLISINIKNNSNENVGLINTPNLLFICADDSQISVIQANVAISSNPNVIVNSYCSFTPGGNYNTITGNIKFDANNNGCDSSDLPQSNIRININDGTNQGAAFTNNSGNYNFYTQAGNFVLTPNIENPTWFNFSPATATIPFANNNNNTTIQNFCISANGIHPDLEIVIAPVTPARPGFDAVYQIVYKNKGNQTLSQLYGVNFFYNQNLMNFVSATTAPATIGSGSLSWSYANLLPFESRSIYVTLNINTPTDVNYPVNIGDVLQFTTSILPIAGDETTTDNTFLYNQTVVGSYDPNDITCIEGTSVSPSKIGDYLHYNINFENTGTAAATFVVIKDIIDIAKFDINSLQIIDSSHPMTTRVSSNKVEFIFDNINLAVSQHGNVVFKIKTKSTLVTGNTVTNNANIYFDYNFPILTNTASTTFQSLNNGQFSIDNSIVVSPNPTNGFLFVVSDAIVKLIQLFDVHGRLLETKLMDDTSEIIDISEESKGIYFLKITSELGSKVEKIVKK